MSATRLCLPANAPASTRPTIAVLSYPVHDLGASPAAVRMFVPTPVSGANSQFPDGFRPTTLAVPPHHRPPRVGYTADSRLIQLEISP